MDNKITLRGMVVSIFGNISEFAQSIGWSYSKAYRIVSGDQIPDLNDVREICKALQVADPEDICKIFYLP